MKDVVLKVDGMSCGHCVRAVEAALKELDGVEIRGVQIGRAEAGVADAVEIGVLIDALADAGYRAEEQPG